MAAVNEIVPTPGAEEFSYKPDNPTFKATVAPDKAGESFLRDVDTEIKF